MDSVPARAQEQKMTNVSTQSKTLNLWNKTALQLSHEDTNRTVATLSCRPTFTEKTEIRWSNWTFLANVNSCSRSL